MGSDRLLNIDEFKKIYEPYNVLIEKDEYVNENVGILMIMLNKNY